MNIINALQWRYAVRQFSEQKVSNEDLTQLLNATRLSASSYGLQPYKVLVIESDTVRQKLLPHSYGQDKIANSSHLVIFAAETNIGDQTVDKYIDKYVQISNKSNQELNNYSEHMKSALSNKTDQQKQQWAHQQCYIALGNLLTCAAIMKIDSCPMTGIDVSGYDRVLGLTEQGLTTSVICPIGYRHHEDQSAHNPKIRFDYNEIVRVI
jgi:nitroreductase